MLKETINQVNVILFWYLLLIKLPETDLWFESIVSKPTTDFTITFHPGFHYFLFYFKNMINTKTTYIEPEFCFILRLLEVLVPNFMLKFLRSQNIDMGVFLIPPLMLSSCYHLMWLEYSLIFVPRQMYSFLKTCS